MKAPKLIRYVKLQITGKGKYFHVNRKYKDRLFCALFSKDREALLQIYNALHKTSYENAEELDIVTVDNVIYMGMKNDLAFMLAGVLNLYEHQSSLNPNMPIRFLLYLSEEYQIMIAGNKENIYGNRLIKLPTPQCVVFYNGDEAVEDNKVLKLSDAFENKKVQPDVELTVHLCNINMGHNPELLKKCHKLWEYSYLVHQVKLNLAAGMSRDRAVEQAVTHCIEMGILADFLTENRMGVLGMLLTEYNEKKVMKMIARDAREDGYQEGKNEGKIEGKVEGKAEAILQILSELGELPEELKERILAEKDMEVLDKWLVTAVRAESVQEFSEKEAYGL